MAKNKNEKAQGAEKAAVADAANTLQEQLEAIAGDGTATPADVKRAEEGASFLQDVKELMGSGVHWTRVQVNRLYHRVRNFGSCVLAWVKAAFRAIYHLVVSAIDLLLAAILAIGTAAWDIGSHFVRIFVPSAEDKRAAEEREMEAAASSLATAKLRAAEREIAEAQAKAS